MSAKLEAIERDRELVRQTMTKIWEKGWLELGVYGGDAVTLLQNELRPLPGPRPYEGIAQKLAEVLHAADDDYDEWRFYNDEDRRMLSAAVQAALEQAIPEDASLIRPDKDNPGWSHSVAAREHLATWQPPAGDARD